MRFGSTGLKESHTSNATDTSTKSSITKYNSSPDALPISTLNATQTGYHFPIKNVRKRFRFFSDTAFLKNEAMPEKSIFLIILQTLLNAPYIAQNIK